MSGRETLNQTSITGDYISDSGEAVLRATDANALIELIKNGDQQAFIELYHSYSRPIYNFIFRLIHSETGAEDVLQEVFLAVWRGANRFRGKSSVKTWIYRIAFNQSMSWLRSHRQYARNVSIDDPPMISEEDDTDILDRQRMQKSLDQLSVKHRAVVELTYVYGMNYREVAETLRIPIGTVKSRMKYALKALAQSFNDMGIDRKESK